MSLEYAANVKAPPSDAAASSLRSMRVSSFVTIAGSGGVPVTSGGSRNRTSRRSRPMS